MIYISFVYICGMLITIICHKYCFALVWCDKTVMKAYSYLCSKCMFYSKHIIIAAHNIFLIFWEIFWCLMPLSATLQLYSGGGSRSTQRRPPTLGKQLVNFITCSCESSAPFFVICKAGSKPTPYW